MGVMGYVPGGPAGHRPRERLALPGSAYRRPACSPTGQQDTGNLRSQAAAELRPVLIHPLRTPRPEIDRFTAHSRVARWCSPAVSAPDGCGMILIEGRVDHRGHDISCCLG